MRVCVRRGGWALLLSVALGACAAEDGVTQRDVDATTRLETVVAAQGQYVEFPLCQEGQTCGRINGSVDLRLVACSAKISCEPSLLHDPQTLERGATLVTGFSCGFPDGTPAQDALLAYHPTVRCYRSGNLGDRTTWVPAGGIEPEFGSGEHIFYSQDSTLLGDVYTNAAMLMRPLKEASAFGAGEYGFCEISAWGAVAFSERDEGPLVDPECIGDACKHKRRGTHVQWAPAIQWRAVVAYDAATGWDCHASGMTPETWVKRVVLTAATHDLPTPEVKGQLPAIQDFAFLSVEPRVDQESQTLRVHQSLMLRYAEDSAFPEAPQANPSSMIERDLWTRYPESGPAADVAVSWSCAEVDAAGQVSRIGVLLRDDELQIPLGALVIDRWDGSQSWSCRQNALGGCRLFEREEWATLTPCLLPAAPL